MLGYFLILIRRVRRVEVQQNNLRSDTVHTILYKGRFIKKTVEWNNINNERNFYLLRKSLNIINVFPSNVNPVFIA